MKKSRKIKQSGGSRKQVENHLSKLQERIEKLEHLDARQLEKRQKLAIQLLETLNQPGEKMDLIRRILLAMKESAGFECVAIRLKEKDDYPYYVTNGFPEDFIEMERYLCARDNKGNPLRDSDGNPVLDCMCGNIIRGRTDPKYPFFTRNGSFWSNNTTKLLASTSEKERQARTRNRCNAQGYESVALIPLRINSDTIGLLQLNDSRTDMFTPGMIHFFERIGSSIGIAFKRKKTEEELLNHRNHLEDIVKEQTDSLKHLNAILHAIRNVNQLITRERDRGRLLQETCDKLIETRGYLSTWLVVLDKSGKFVTSAQSGLDSDFIPMQEWLKKGRLANCIQNALKQAGPLVIDKSEALCSGCPLSGNKVVSKRMLIRLEYHKNIFGALLVALPQDVIPSEEEQGLLQEVAGDIAFALHNMDVEKKHKQSEESLRESEETLRVVFDNANDGILLAEAETRKFHTGNKTICRMLGYTLEEIKGLGVTHIHPEKDLPYVTAQFEKQLRGEIRIASDMPIKKKDGSVFYADINSNPLTLFGKTYLMGIFRDITERKKTEQEMQKLSNVVEQTADIVIITDKDGLIQYVNPAFEKLTGYDKDGVIGKTPGILKSGEQDNKFYENLWKTIISGNTFRAELVNRRKDGTLYYEEKTITPVKNQQGVITNFVSLGKNITERKKLEQQLLQSQKMEAVGRLAGGVAHDFNNILTVIDGYCSMTLEDFKDNQPLVNNIQIVRKSVERAANLTRQLLAFSRKQPLQTRPLNLNSLVTDMGKMLHRVISENIKLTEDLSPELAAVQADPGQIEQVLMNLVINARDAMPTGGQITIKTANAGLSPAQAQAIPDAQPGNFVRLVVQDTGTGMNPETMGHLFEPFFTTKEQGKGTGLGMSVVYGIVKQHNGWVNVRSEAGKGSVFDIYLPVAAAPSTAQANNKIKIGVSKTRGASQRILLIEDEPGIREIIAFGLRKSGYQVLEAATLAEARRIFKREKKNFDIIFSDVILPDGNGAQLAEELSALNPKLRIILSSGYVDDRVQMKVIEDKGYQFLPKPYNLTRLINTILKL